MSPDIRHLLRQIRNSNRTMIARTGEISPRHIAILITQAIQVEAPPGAVLLGLAEFIGRALDGEVPDIDSPSVELQAIAK